VAARQQHLHHVADLVLVGMADPDHRLFDEIRRIFRHRHPGAPRHQQRHGPGSPELQGGAGILVDEGFLHRGLVGLPFGDDRGELAVQVDQPHRERLRPVGLERAVGHIGQPRPLDGDDAPARLPQARVDADDANRPAAHGLRC
jgi:hypothetical protein